MKNLPILRNDSSFAVEISISFSKTRAILLFKIKIKLNERMPGMRSAEYQVTIPLNFFIIMRMFRQSNNQNHYPVFFSIQTLLRAENDLKQSDEFQTRVFVFLYKFYLVIDV